MLGHTISIPLNLLRAPNGWSERNPHNSLSRRRTLCIIQENQQQPPLEGVYNKDQPQGWGRHVLGFQSLLPPRARISGGEDVKSLPFTLAGLSVCEPAVNIICTTSPRTTGGSSCARTFYVKIISRKCPLCLHPHQHRGD